VLRRRQRLVLPPRPRGLRLLLLRREWSPVLLLGSRGPRLLLRGQKWLSRLVLQWRLLLLPRPRGLRLLLLRRKWSPVLLLGSRGLRLLLRRQKWLSRLVLQWRLLPLPRPRGLRLLLLRRTWSLLLLLRPRGLRLLMLRQRRLVLWQRPRWLRPRGQRQRAGKGRGGMSSASEGDPGESARHMHGVPGKQGGEAADRAPHKEGDARWGGDWAAARDRRRRQGAPRQAVQDASDSILLSSGGGVGVRSRSSHTPGSGDPGPQEVDTHEAGVRGASVNEVASGLGEDVAACKVGAESARARAPLGGEHPPGGAKGQGMQGAEVRHVHEAWGREVPEAACAPVRQPFRNDRVLARARPGAAHWEGRKVPAHSLETQERIAPEGGSRAPRTRLERQRGVRGAGAKCTEGNDHAAKGPWQPTLRRGVRGVGGHVEECKGRVVTRPMGTEEQASQWQPGGRVSDRLHELVELTLEARAQGGAEARLGEAGCQSSTAGGGEGQARQAARALSEGEEGEEALGPLCVAGGDVRVPCKDTKATRGRGASEEVRGHTRRAGLTAAVHKGGGEVGELLRDRRGQRAHELSPVQEGRDAVGRGSEATAHGRQAEAANLGEGGFDPGEEGAPEVRALAFSTVGVGDRHPKGGLGLHHRDATHRCGGGRDRQAKREEGRFGGIEALRGRGPEDLHAVEEGLHMLNRQRAQEDFDVVCELGAHEALPTNVNAKCGLGVHPSVKGPGSKEVEGRRERAALPDPKLPEHGGRGSAVSNNNRTAV
jgi:hypothetical protein